MPLGNRVVTFNGTITNTGTVAATYQVTLRAQHIHADGSPFTQHINGSPQYTIPAGGSAVAAVSLDSIPTVPNDQIWNISASLAITSPQLITGLATVNGNDLKESPPVVPSGTMAGSITVTAKFAAGLVKKAKGYGVMGKAVRAVTR
jgi:hypothetical protein